MEELLVGAKQVEEKEDSANENEDHDQTTTKENNVAAVEPQHAEPSKKDPCHHPSLLVETLRRQFLEYEEMAALFSPEEQERRLLAILSLFLKAWEHSTGNLCFPHIQLLASEASKLLVKKIKKKMHGKPAEEARLLVWRFLQKEEETTEGYVLLRSVYLLSPGNLEEGIQWTVIKSGLPVALLQCLYLFFAFPSEDVDGNSEMSEGEQQTQEMFVQTMLNIYAEPQGVEELLGATDLQSLITATASLWDQGSCSWKGPTSHVLQTISKTQSQNIVLCLQATNCIKISIQNLSKLADSLPPYDICVAINIILAFVKNSYSISPALLSEFESNGGYQLLLKVFLRYDGLLNSKEDASFKETLDFLTHLTVCGKTELKVSGNTTYPQLSQFKSKQPSSGNRVKNLKAFQVLESLFRKSNNAELCQSSLQAIKSIWSWDSMNFFLLEWSLQPISQFVGIIPQKPPSVQAQFFQLLESIVLDLLYIPHEILKEVQNLIKENVKPLCTSLALRSLYAITQSDPLFTDIFRDSGLLGTLLAQLRKEAKILRKKGRIQADCQDQTTEKKLISMTLKMVAALVVGSARNTVVLRDYGMVPFIKIFVDDDLYRNDTLMILEQLSVINPEEYMSFIVGALCSSTQGELNLKLDLLKSLLRTLENPRGCSAFRTSSGFNGLLSLLSDMEGALEDPPSALWTSVDHCHAMELILCTLQVIAAALYLDPVNSDFFQKHDLFEKMAEDLGLLGCFSAPKSQQIPVSLHKTRSFAEFSSAVCSSEYFPTWLKSCITILTFFDHMAKGNCVHFKNNLVETNVGINELPTCIQEAKENETDETEDSCEKIDNNKTASSLWPESKNKSDGEEWVIAHPGALCVMVKLLPKLYNDAHLELSWEIQYAVADHIQSLLRLEKNRQVACGAGLLDAVVTSCLEALHDTSNPLHLPLIRIFEKLASQSIEPAVLRRFLFHKTSLTVAPETSLSSPRAPLCHKKGLHQAASDEGSEATTPNNSADHQAPLGSDTSRISESSEMALQAAMSLISMTTPRSLEPQSICLAPSFVEFDMSLEGYGCLFLPTLATVLGPKAEYSVSGGIGKGPRLFPPLGGLTFSSWFLVSRMGSIHHAHPLRFLTLVRHMARTEEEFTCFAVSFSPMDGCLTISTEETTLQALDIMEPEAEDISQSSVLSQVQFSCASLLVTRQWNHLAVIVAKETKRICTVTAFINGQLVGSAKMQYIQPLPGGFVSMDPSSFIDVYGYVATPQIWKQNSPLTWRQGPMYLFEEVISAETLELIIKLGPRYCGNFQAVELRGRDFCSSVQTAPLVAQEKISFGISAMSSSYTTVKDIKDCYGEVDGRLIAKELALSSRDNTTPVFLARNTSGKLSGPLRSIGSVIVGQYGTRVFQCCPAAISLNYIGGPAILLNLLDMAHNDHAMYAAVKVLHSVLNSSVMSEKLLRDIGGYQILAYLLKRKTHLLNHRILQLIFSIGGIVETNMESLNIKSLDAFQHIICNFEVWCHAPENLDLSLFARLTEILQYSRNGSWNAKLAHQGQMVPKLFLLFSDPEVTCSRISRICAVLSHLLQGHFNIKDIHWIGLFLVYTLSPTAVDESQICLNEIPESPENVLCQMPGKMIWLRNQLLRVILDAMYSSEHHLSSEMQEVVFQALGPDWFLMFMQGHVHPSTVLLAIKLLLHVLHNRSLLHKFKEGVMAGLWLENSSVGLNLLIDNLKCHARIFKFSPYLLSGFEELKTFLHNHTHIPEIYFLLSGLFLATPVFEPPAETKADLDSMLQWLLQIHHKDAVAIVGLCPEAAVLLLEMVKSMVKRTPIGTEISLENTYSENIMQFFCQIHHRYPHDPLWCNSDFLQALALVIFPSGIPQDSCESRSAPNHLAADSCSERDIDGLPASVPLHHAKKQVWDFIRLLLMETLLVVPQKLWHSLELLLEASAENSSTEHKRWFQTEILLSVMDIFHIIGQRDGEISSLRGNNDVRSASEPSFTLILMNISYLTQKVVEKLYAGMFLADPKKIILFFVEHLILVIGKVFPQKEPVISILYSGLNRTILYYLSSSISDHQRLLNILHILQQQWDVIFAMHNSSSIFITCLLFCLTQLMPMSFEHEATLRPLSDHLAPHTEDEVVDDSSAPKNVQQEIWKAAAGIWNQLLSQRRKDLEDTYKMPLFVERGGGDEKMDMANFTPLWEETMAKTWQQFLGSEKKAPQNKVPTQALNKMSSWSESLSSAIKLTPSRNIKRIGCKTKDFISCLEKYRRIGQELYAVLYKDHVRRLQRVYNKAGKAWTDIKEQIFGRGGPWGSALSPSVSRWVLDGFEGPARMRKRIRFNITYQTSVPVEIKAHQTHENTSALTPEEHQEQLMLNGEEKGMDCGQLTFFPALHESVGSDDLLDVCMERKTILQEFADDEKIFCRQSVVIVQEHIALEGVLLFGQEHFYICKYFTLSHLEEVYCTRHCLSSISDSFIYSMCHKDHAMGQPTCSCYSYGDIKELHRMRFLLQEIALEIFFKSGYSIFLVFHNGDRKKAIKRFCSIKPILKSKGITEDSINIRSSTTGGEKSMLLKWQRREISNFDYLMYLNTLAGRTYNDLMQYPVFPWVLADYHSQTLDLTNPSVFRDLSKPMGAQTAERTEKFIQRYKEVEKSEGNLSAQCHYCTHYSSAIIVASYLVRIEPFTQIFCSLQGGGFDVADRMFHSLKSTWDSVSRDNMTDVRELTPEFFYLPEFLTNLNHFEFGNLQDGTSLDDVQLPPWAEGNPQRFINLHRQALESNYVSAHLHHWIDLIFGHKQHGPAAVKAMNIFHPYFYGDQVNLDSITDPLIKSTILGFVSNFGQIPKQLFIKPHPARNAQGKHSMGRENMLFAYPAGQLPPSLSNLHNLKFSYVTVKEAPQGPVGHIVSNEKGILAVGKNKILLPPLWNKMFCWGFDDFTCCITGYGSDKSMITFEATADWGDCLCAVCPTPRTLITSGSSSVMCFWELSTTKDGSTCLKLVKPLYGHTQPVTCLAASTSFSIIVSGSADRSCIIWDLNQLTRITQLPAHEACLSAVAINDSTGDIASCAGVALHLWNINGQPLASLNPAISLGVTITCCCFIEVMDWDIHSLIVTGDTSGSVQVWKLENASHPCQNGNIRLQEDSPECQSNKGNKPGEPFALCRELNLSTTPSERPSKAVPAVTTLATSRNYSKLLAGDENGKIYCWSVDG